MEKEKDNLFWHRYIDNLYTTEDARKILKGEHETSDEEDLLEKLASDVWEESASMKPCTDVEREKYKEEARQLLRRIDRKKRTSFRRLVTAAIGIAAMFVLIWGSISHWRFNHQSKVTWLTISTSYGEQKDIRLPDGTRLTLNACSQVRYPERFAEKERRIKLEGEGFFQVTHQEEQPFIVTTKTFNVQVLGTCFNVKAYSSDATMGVDVESGKVQVDMPEAMMRLKADEQVVINHTTGEYSKRHNGHEVAVWRNGGLRFDATPIRDVAKVLERKYDCHITFADGQDFNNLISGEHDNRSLEAVLQSIEYTSGIHFRISGNQVLLYKENLSRN